MAGWIIAGKCDWGKEKSLEPGGENDFNGLIGILERPEMERR